MNDATTNKEITNKAAPNNEKEEMDLFALLKEAKSQKQYELFGILRRKLGLGKHFQQRSGGGFGKSRFMRARIKNA